MSKDWSLISNCHVQEDRLQNILFCYTIRLIFLRVYRSRQREDGKSNYLLAYNQPTMSSTATRILRLNNISIVT